MVASFPVILVRLRVHEGQQPQPNLEAVLMQTIHSVLCLNSEKKNSLAAYNNG